MYFVASLKIRATFSSIDTSVTVDIVFTSRWKECLRYAISCCIFSDNLVCACSIVVSNLVFLALLSSISMTDDSSLSANSKYFILSSSLIVGDTWFNFILIV